MNSTQRIIGAVLLLSALAGTATLEAATTNYWTNAVGTASWNTAGNWDPNSVPVATNMYVHFTNNAASAYTVQFDAASTSGAFHVTSDKIVFDLNGYSFYGAQQFEIAAAGENSHAWSDGAGETSTVTISSSAAPAISGGNTFDMGSALGYWQNWRVGTDATLTIDQSLSTNAVVVKAPGQFSNGGTLTIDGQTLQGPSAGGKILLGGTINVMNGGTLDSVAAADIGTYYWASRGYVTVTSNSAFKGSVHTLGFGGIGIVDVNSNSSWNVTGNLQVGSTTVFFPGDPRQADALVDNSSLYAGSVIIGDGSTGNGRLIIQNGSTAVISNGYLLVDAGSYSGVRLAYTNEFVLNNSTLAMGQTGADGALTNRGIMSLNGVISGLGTGPALVRNEGELNVGSSIGTLVLSNANLEMSSDSVNLFEFSDTGLDQINVVNGYASLDGTNVFSLAAGSALPEPGYKWGLGTYDFVLATGVTAGANFYANITNLLGSYGLTENLDYRFGVMGLGGGLEALRLEFVPEPSTILLLLGGGLVLWRFRRKRGGVLLLAALLLLGASGSYAVDYVWTNEASGTFGTAGNWDPNSVPAAGDSATIGASGATNLTVTFGGNQSSDYLVVTGGTTSVTLDLGGFTYDVDNGGSEVWVGSNATDNVGFVINNGTLDAEGGAGSSYIGYNNSTVSMVISNGGTFRYNNVTLGDNTTVLVTDPGSQWYGGGGSAYWNNGTVILSNGATAYVANPNWSAAQAIITGPGTVWTNYVGGRTIGAGGSRFELLDGARFQQSGQWEFGVFSGTQTAIVSGAGGNVSTAEVGHIMFGTTFDANRGAPELLVNAGGIVRAGSSPTVVNTTNVAAWVYDKATLTLNGGILEVRTNSAVYTANVNATLYGKGLLRGSGTISALAGTDKFTVYNDGIIQPGDTNATARIGTLNLVQGDLVQGNASGELLFDFDPLTPGSADLISITGGNAIITAGSNTFNNITGATTIGFGTWNFLRADSITYTPAYDNLTNIVDGLVATLSPALYAGYTYGVVDMGSYDLLQLSVNMVPEPSTILLLVGGGLLVFRLRHGFGGQGRFWRRK